jgi:hypothetical protein
MPFLALIIGAGAVAYFARRFRRARVAQPETTSRIDATKYQQRLEDELKTYTPED